MSVQTRYSRFAYYRKWNITDDQRAYLIGKGYKEEKKEHGGDRKSEKVQLKPEETSIRHSDDLKPTVQKIAEQLKVGLSTVQRAKKFADAVDKVAENVVVFQATIKHNNTCKC